MLIKGIMILNELLQITRTKTSLYKLCIFLKINLNQFLTKL